MATPVIQGNTGNLFKVRCQWCKSWPEVQTHNEGKYWAICVTDGCPVNPVTWAADTPAGAIKLWNSVKQ